MNVRLLPMTLLRTGLLSALLASALIPGAQASSTIDQAHPFAWSANVGWSDWYADGSNGVVVSKSFCSGWIYAANVGWISLGNGAPANGANYQNNSSSDFGVNVDELGNLRGYAYGANIGWINFESQGAPRVDLLTGDLSGNVWSANVGWISLSNSVAYLQSEVAGAPPPTGPIFGGNSGSPAIRFTPSGVELQVMANPGVTLELQESVDLVTWKAVQTLQSPSGTFLFQVSEPIGETRFYRAIQR